VEDKCLRKHAILGGSVRKVARVEEKKHTKGDHKYMQPIWCPRGLNKTQRGKLQRA
jgi:hypothetical protein